MSYARPKIEDEIVMKHLTKEIHALSVDRKLREKFISFAVEEGSADTRKFPPRLNHVLNHGRTPSSYIAILLKQFFDERRWENFVRTTKDYVEFITDDGLTEPLEEFVKNHPLFLRIVGARMTTGKFDDAPEKVTIRLRSPISGSDKTVSDQALATVQFNNRQLEFKLWLNSQGSIPKTIQLPNDRELKVEYWPDWCRYSDESETDSDEQGQYDISSGIDLMLNVKFGRDSPSYGESSIGAYWELMDILVGEPGNKLPKRASFVGCWPRIVEGQEKFTQLVLTHQDSLPEETISPILKFFRDFATQNEDWVAKATADSERANQSQKEDRVADLTDVLHYAKVESAFFSELKPILKPLWTGFAKKARELMLEDQVKFDQHWKKMQRKFGF